MKKRAVALLMLLCCLNLTSCSRLGALTMPIPKIKPIAITIQDSAKIKNAEDFTALMTEINIRNESLDAPNTDFANDTYDIQANADKLCNKSELSDFNRSYKESRQNEYIVQEDAVADTQWLFKVFRTVYGPYQAYGGDAVFGSAEDGVLEQLNNVDEISSKEFNGILKDNLSFITDSHLRIGETSFRPTYQTYISNTQFVKTSKGFYDAFNGKYIRSIDGKPPEAVLKHSISEGGKLTYQYTVVSEKPPNGKLEYADATIALMPLTSFKQKTETPQDFQLTIKDGIPILRMDSMLAETPSTNATQFVNSAKKIKEYPAAIIDLRNNPGGYSDLCARWFKAYTGETLSPNCSTLFRYFSGGSQSSRVQKDYIQLIPGWYRSPDLPQYLTNEGPVLFILVGRGTASAAESFTDAMRNLSNTVVVGTNTAGYLSADLRFPNRQLPKSGLALDIGGSYYSWNPDYFQEGKGLEPDLWLTGSNEEERLLSFVKRYVTEKRM